MFAVACEGRQDRRKDAVMCFKDEDSADNPTRVKGGRRLRRPKLWLWDLEAGTLRPHRRCSIANPIVVIASGVAMQISPHNL